LHIVSQPFVFYTRSCQVRRLWTGRLLVVFLALFILLLPVGPVSARDLPIRLEVVKTAIHEVSYAELGLSAPVPSAGLQLSRQGSAIAMWLADGSDGLFGPGDSMRFHGRAVSRSDRLYKFTGTAVYRLEQLPVGQQGLRMSDWQLSACPCQSLTSYRETLHAEDNRIYWQQLPNGVGVDHWFWGGELRVDRQQTYHISLPGLVGGQPQIRVHLHGSTSGTHLTRLLINGNLVTEVSWPPAGVDGATPYTLTAQVPAALMGAGANAVTIVGRDAGSPQDGIYVDWIEVDYDQGFVADAGELAFSLTGVGPQQLALQGFKDPSEVEVYALSDPDRPRRLGPGGTSLQINPARVSGPFIAVAPAGVSRPVVASFSVDALRSVTNRADYIVVTDERLVAAVEPLRLHRESQGLRSRVVTMSAIYDAFADGFADPDAIKAFLSYTYQHWQPPRPQYVLLLGDANFDYRDYFGNNQPNLVPAHLIETPGFGEVPSDNWFVTVSGNDPYPDMWIGRIPASTEGEVSMVVNKILKYEAGMSGDWPSRVIAASGDNKPEFSHSQQRFIDGTNSWLSRMPATYEVVSIATSAVPVAQYVSLRGAFSQSLNGAGAGFVSYFGHGAIDAWLASDSSGVFSADALELLRSSDMSSLSNTRAYPFVAAFNCLNGLFSLPTRQRLVNASGTELMSKSLVPLAEALLFQSDKGVIGMMAATSLAYASEQTAIGDALFANLFDDTQSQKVLGEVVGRAKIQAVRDQGVDPQNLDIMTLIGDPATRLAIRGGRTTGVSNVPASGGSGSGGGGGGGAAGGLLILVVAARYLRRRPSMTSLPRPERVGRLSRSWRP